jgi:DNA-directed RNA polymerase specialized sigma subunit
MTRVIGSEEDTPEVSLLAVDQYFRWLRRSGSLSREEERVLFEQVEQGRWEAQQDPPDQAMLRIAKQARDRLVEGFQPLVISLAQHYQRVAQSMEPLDLIQEGTVGLLKAIDRYRARSGGFTGFAGRCIVRAICDALFRRDRGVHLSDTLAKEMRQVRRIRKLLCARQEAEPTVQEIAEELHRSEAEVRQLFYWWGQQEVVSLQGLYEGEDDAEDLHVLVEVRASEQVEAEQDEAQRLLLILRESGGSVCLPLRAVVEQVFQAWAMVLTERQRETLRLRYGLDGCSLTYQAIAEQMGLSLSAIRYYETEALKRLRRVVAPLCA